ncbi:MAG: TIGR02587 family membrane protein [Leptolyngbyaceae cyanobacterium CSU_1_4]|nr:TIGR02587 family membrane protein [Leptolyngbyaceae cyanobacterium CSU_1_4]
MNKNRRRQQAHWIREVEDITRGACGGFLFGIPLLYTMEVWWIGSTVSPPLMLLAIATTWTVVFFLNRTEGFRRTTKVSFTNAARDTVEAVVIGLVCTGIMLVILQEVTLQTQLSEALGKVIFESVPFSLGVALSNQFLSSNPEENRVQSSKQNSTAQVEARQPEISETLADIGATLIGAIIIAFSIAPTDEIPMLAAATSAVWLLATVVISLIISYGIVFEANFANKTKRQQQRGLFQSPLSETIMSYLLSLVAAAMMLWFFQQLDFSDPGAMWLSYTLLLGLPATIGGAAGRLAI